VMEAFDPEGEVPYYYQPDQELRDGETSVCDV
jgi:hypothetical protein